MLHKVLSLISGTNFVSFYTTLIAGDGSNADKFRSVYYLSFVGITRAKWASRCCIKSQRIHCVHELQLNTAQQPVALTVSMYAAQARGLSRTSDLKECGQSVREGTMTTKERNSTRDHTAHVQRGRRMHLHVNKWPAKCHKWPCSVILEKEGAFYKTQQCRLAEVFLSMPPLAALAAAERARGRQINGSGKPKRTGSQSARHAKGCPSWKSRCDKRRLRHFPFLHRLVPLLRVNRRVTRV